MFSVGNAFNQKLDQHTMCDKAREGSVTVNGLLPAPGCKTLNPVVPIANKSQPTFRMGQENKASSVLLTLRLGKVIAALLKLESSWLQKQSKQILRYYL